MLIITTTTNTPNAIAKALETTGTVLPPKSYRLHRDTCPRINAKSDARPVDAAAADEVWAAQPCTRCSPNKGEVTEVKMAARKEAKAEAENDSTDYEVHGTDETGQHVSRADDEAALTESVEGWSLEVYAGPAAEVDPETGLVKPIRPAAYPEVKGGSLKCAGACGQVLPASNFQFVTKKGDGRGRMVECTKDQVARLAANKAAVANGQPKIPSPKFA